jgi:GT2 family glycosyltransferase
MHSKVNIAIVNFNSGSYLRNCLEALARQSFTDFSVTVIDNASSDASIDRAISPGSYKFPLKVMELDKNYGFARANNTVLSLSKSEYFVTLNPDAFPEAGWLAALVKAGDAYPAADMFGSSQITYGNGDVIDGAGDCYSIYGIPWRGGYGRSITELPREDVEVFSPCAAAAMYRTEKISAIGGFDESFFCYCEDLDLGFRLRNSGSTAIQVHDALVYHVGSGIVGKGSEFATYYGFRNRIWLYFKNMPWIIIATFPVFLCTQVLLIIYSAIKTFKSGSGFSNIKPSLKGLVDGLAKTPTILARRIKQGNVENFFRVSDTLKTLRLLSYSPFSLFKRAIISRKIT